MTLFFLLFTLKITGQTGEYTRKNYRDKPISRQGLSVVKKIAQKVEEVINKIIKISKYLINGDDCELSDKQAVVDLWEKHNKQVLDMAKEVLPDIKDDEPLNIDSLSSMLKELKKKKKADSPIDVPQDDATPKTSTEDEEPKTEEPKTN